MKFYNEILGLHDSFSPYYRLNDEREGYWKEFIPTKQFYKLLDNVLESVDGDTIANRKSFWIHGTYGTGKSHATGVIKKLLYSPLEEIESYIDRFQNRNDLKHRLLNFRKTNKAFPVVMYGSSNITNQWDFVLEIEKAVRNALTLNNIEITIKTEFDTYIEKINSEKSNFWDNVIESTPELSELVDNKEDLIKQLQYQDKDVLYEVRKGLSKKGITVHVEEITTWIKDIIQELSSKYIANKLVIYWDEFTSIMDSGNSGIINQIQKLAELSEDYGLFMYLISHRTQRQGVNKDDRKHILGRFIDIDYQMSDITTYHLMSNYIKKNDIETWKILRNDKNEIIENLINKISEFEDADVKENVKNLFPIHPYTAFMSSLIARIIGSSDRSIFKFLNDENEGFRFFIANQPNKGRFFLTSEYVFDFFIKDFEEEGSSFLLTLLDRFKYDRKQIEKQNSAYLSLFKGILLLNISHRILNVGTDNNDLVIPNKENLELMFYGSSIMDQIDNFLVFIHKEKIIYRDHQNRYIVETSSLDPTEVNSARRNIENNYNTIEKIIESDAQENLFNTWKNNHRRKDITEVLLMDCESEPHSIYRKIGKFKHSYSLKIIAFIARDHSVLKKIENTLNDLDGEKAVNIIFVIIESLFTSDEYDEFIEMRAKAEVSQKRNLKEDENKYLKNSEKIIETWIKKVNDFGYIKWYLKDAENTIHTQNIRFKDMSNDLNSNITKIIYKNSFDLYSKQMNTLTAWQDQMTKKSAEIFLTSNNLDELIKLCKGPATITQSIIKDNNGTYIVREDLKIIQRDPSLPINKMISKLDNRIKSGDDINLADAFSFLFKPPFGFYKCHVFLASAGFLMRKYRNKLYDRSTGEIITDNILKGMIESIFQYHCDNKQNARKSLFVRLGSQDEKKLVQLIQKIFSLTQCNSLIDTKHLLYEWVKTNLGFPLWLYNYADIDNEEIDEILMSINTINTKILDCNAKHEILCLEDIKNIYKEIEPFKIILNQILTSDNQDSKKQFFLSFFSKIEAISLNESNYDEIMQYLDSNLQEDPVFWNEEKIRGLLKDWYIKKIEPVTNTIGLSNNNVYQSNSSDNLIVSKKIVEDKDRILKKINNFHGDYENILIKLINKRPDILFLLEKLLNGEEL